VPIYIAVYAYRYVDLKKAFTLQYRFDNQLCWRDR